MRLAFLAILLFAVGGLESAASQDWQRFGWDVLGTSAPTESMGITPTNVGSLRRQQIAIDGTVDSSAIYLHGVMVKGAKHDAFFVTTTYGKTLAIDADNGTVLWEYTPPTYARLAGTYRITNATPVADPDRQFIYAAAPDGEIRKLAIADGRLVWSTPITKLPQREKIASPLSFFTPPGGKDGRVIAATDGYIGDAPPYQGHVAVLDGATGDLLHVWNSLCSDRHELIDPGSCPASDSGIWGRAGVTIDPSTGNMYLATGNGPWNGTTNWGDSVIELDPDATRILGNYTPANTEQLDREDADLGSTSPVLLGSGLVAQGGKDGFIRLIDWSKMAGTTPHRGGALDRVSTPSGRRLFTAPAVMHFGSTTWLFAADNGGTSAWTIGEDRFHPQWHNENPGTSPVVADGMLFVYDPSGGLHVYLATTGRQLTVLQCGSGHWNSPIVVDGRIALPEGNANYHQTHGVLDIWRLP